MARRRARLLSRCPVLGSRRGGVCAACATAAGAWAALLVVSGAGFDDGPVFEDCCPHAAAHATKIGTTTAAPTPAGIRPFRGRFIGLLLRPKCGNDSAQI